jgi:hypothetical protein
MLVTRGHRLTIGPAAIACSAAGNGGEVRGVKLTPVFVTRATG